MPQVPSDEEIEWLTKLASAADVGATFPQAPDFVAEKFREIGFVWSSGLGRVEITEAGRNFLKRLDEQC